MKHFSMKRFSHLSKMVFMTPRDVDPHAAKCTRAPPYHVVDCELVFALMYILLSDV